ncbi:hypothetical protein H0H93_015653 [Arthromyces matolae]|nr:hypothetical protein H0H93_015653 [Arthromyces matolae]
MFTRALTLSAVLSLAAAQLSLSTACQTALTSIAISPDAGACLVPGPLITILTNSSASIVDPINNWLTSLCAAPACSNDTLAGVVANATKGCSTEFATFGISSTDISGLTTLVQQYYPAVRQAVCLKHGSTNCVTETLTNAQNILGTLSLTAVVTIATSGANETLPANVTCTDCVKGIYNIANTAAPGLIDSSGVSGTCGTSFIDGTTPSDITESASSSTTSTTQGNDAGQLSFNTLSGLSIIAALAMLV